MHLPPCSKTLRTDKFQLNISDTRTTTRLWYFLATARLSNLLELSLKIMIPQYSMTQRDPFTTHLCQHRSSDQSHNSQTRVHQSACLASVLCLPTWSCDGRWRSWWYICSAWSSVIGASVCPSTTTWSHCRSWCHRSLGAATCFIPPHVLSAWQIRGGSGGQNGSGLCAPAFVVPISDGDSWLCTGRDKSRIWHQCRRRSRHHCG